MVVGAAVDIFDMVVMDLFFVVVFQERIRWEAIHQVRSDRGQPCGRPHPLLQSPGDLGPTGAVRNEILRLAQPGAA